MGKLGKVGLISDLIYFPFRRILISSLPSLYRHSSGTPNAWFTAIALHWRNLRGRDENNARYPLEAELMILRQHGKVTHIVQMLNNQLYRGTNAENEFNIYRIVQVVWMTDNWEHPPENDKVFDCSIYFPPFGKAIKLEKLQKFQKRWGKEGLAFQQHVQSILNIH